MINSVLELVELPNGDIALCRAGETDEPLVSIRFSPESLEYLGGNRLEVARAMIQAGMEAADHIVEGEFPESASESPEGHHILH